MNNADWILIDTETTGLTAPIFVVELAAQRMQGWKPNGKPFRRLLNPGKDVPPEASRVHGYTKEILERDGESPANVYRDFSQYVQDAPLVAYNLDYDLDAVLLPEWERLKIQKIGTKGFCALRLAQRLLDPVPAGNCKLQTLRQYYKLPERGAHTALGDVETVIDLLEKVLSPIADRRGLKTISDIMAFTTCSWYPSRIVFGKFKGQDYREALTNKAIYDWLEWLSNSPNESSSAMGRWYLSQLKTSRTNNDDFTIVIGGSEDNFSQFNDSLGEIILYQNPKLEEIRKLVSASRKRLAEIEAEYMEVKNAIEATQAQLFVLLHELYQKRDHLRLIVDYRRRYIKTLMENGEDDAADVSNEYDKAKSQTDEDYQHASNTALNRKQLQKEEQAELRSLWKSLVCLYHPDRFMKDASLKETYEQLTAIINKAKEEGDIELLREISSDPNGYIVKQGWKQLDFSEEKELITLKKLYDSIQIQIIQMLEMLCQLRSSSDYELYKLSTQNPLLIEDIAKDLRKSITLEIEKLNSEADKLKQEINTLSGEEASPIG